jgi:hypothetical protein
MSAWRNCDRKLVCKRKLVSGLKLVCNDTLCRGTLIFTDAAEDSIRARAEVIR